MNKFLKKDIDKLRNLRETLKHSEYLSKEYVLTNQQISRQIVSLRSYCLGSIVAFLKHHKEQLEELANKMKGSKFKKEIEFLLGRVSINLDEINEVENIIEEE